MRPKCSPKAEVTASCAEGDTGHVYRGRSISRSPSFRPDAARSPVKIMMNVGNPELAFEFSSLPNAGVGLARSNSSSTRMIGVHPKAILDVSTACRSMCASVIRSARGRGYGDPVSFFVDKLTEGIATIAAAFYPKPVIVRLSDFKSNEYSQACSAASATSRGGEPDARIPRCLALHLASFRDCFELECRALKRVRDEMGLTNVEVMVPFVRTVAKARKVVELLAETACPRRERAEADHDVRDPVERAAGRAVPRILRRLLDRLQRPDAADAGPRPRLRAGGQSLRRARSGGEDAAVDGHLQPAARRASTSASAARARRTTRISREWLMDQGIRACR
jgi:phosphoenolpyruvate synthase/pyruvate phosphate dikinase